MSDWTAGYVADVSYTYGYYTELNPLRAQLAFLNSGLLPPPMATACELGFGQGMSVNLHAAASGTGWQATDFNPTQAGFAQELARVSGADAHLVDQAFAEFCARDDLPEFDFIGLHGIWSWISDANRAVIVDFVRRKLRVGGALYISYNTQPGFAALIPLRHLMTEHADAMSAPGVGTVARIDAALEFSEKLFATNPQYASANPQLADRLKRIKGQNRNYLAHEYFNRDWLPMPFADMARWLAPAKLGFACSAHYQDHFPALNLTAAQQGILQELPDAQFRETVRDYMVNQQFRRDYWVRGGRRLSGLERDERVREQRVILTTRAADVSMKIGTAMGEANMQEDVYAPILDILADHRPCRIGDIERLLKNQGMVLARLLEALMILAGKGDVHAVQDEEAVAAAKPRTDRLNAHLMNKARANGEIGFLASPVTGGGIGVPRMQQLFLRARAEGMATPEAWGRSAWDVLSAQGQRLIKSDKVIESAEDNLSELIGQAKEFAEKRIDVLVALGIA